MLYNKDQRDKSDDKTGILNPEFSLEIEWRMLVFNSVGLDLIIFFKQLLVLGNGSSTIAFSLFLLPTILGNMHIDFITPKPTLLKLV